METASVMDATPHDLELRLIDPAKNRFRLYGLTVCRTLFGELCLRIVWGRIGTRTLRERSEVFSDESALERRRRELLARRRHHGYVPQGQALAPTRSPRSRRGDAPRFVAPSTLFAPLPCPTPSPKPERGEREIVEAHGLSLEDKVVRQLVDGWLAATKALARYLEERRPEAFDLVDVSTLASLYVVASAAA
jgi:predicted DNA-binding WGR domain protein